MFLHSQESKVCVAGSIVHCPWRVGGKGHYNDQFATVTTNNLFTNTRDVIGASTFRPFSKHHFAQRAGVVRIFRIAANLALSFEVAAKMAEFAQTVPIDDQDLPMFAAMRPAMYMQRFGMQHALAEQFSSQANVAIATAAAAQREFVLDQYSD